MNTQTTNLIPFGLPIFPLAQPETKEAIGQAQLIAMWLHGRPDNTQRAYSTSIDSFLAFIGKSLSDCRLVDIQAFADSLLRLKPSSQARMLAAVKSLFKFAKQLGFIPFDTAAVLKLPKAPNTLASRILSEQQVNALLGLPNSSRNHAIIVLLYASGLRVSELCSLKWEDLQPRNNSGQLTTTGKGSKTRSILLPASTWTELQSLPRTSDLVFKLKPNQIRRIVKDAARHAGLGIKVSPHFLRHAHASHALNHNAPVHLVSNTLGHASLASTTRYCHANPDQSSSQFLNL